MRTVHSPPRLSAFRGFLAGLAVCAASAQSLWAQGITGSPNVLYYFCHPALEIPRIQIPLGCEIVDCCPGCPGRGRIDMLIRYSGVGPAVLTFEGLSPELRNFEVTGSGRRMGDSIQIGQGEVRIRGVADAADRRPPVAVLRFAGDTASLQAQAAGDAEEGAETSQGDIAFSVGQFLGRLPVNGFYMRGIRHCAPPRRPELTQDRIRLLADDGAGGSVAVLDARRRGCVNDEIAVGSGTFSVGSVLSNGSCRSEAAIFSVDDAVQFYEGVNTWTDPLGDLLPVDLALNRWQMPVDVRIAVPAALVPTIQLRAGTEIGQADFAFNVNRAGIDFLSRDAVTTVTDPALVNLIGTTAQRVWDLGLCDDAAITGNPAIYTPGRLNVYYVDRAFTGWSCGTSNIVAIGTTARIETLAHEFGHLFSLDHTNGMPGIPATNMMVGGGRNRTGFTLGQAFRMTLTPASVLNSTGVRTTGPTRNCPHGAASDACPPVGMRNP